MNIRHDPSLRATNAKVIALLLAILVGSSFLLLRNISEPWNNAVSGRDGALFSAIARNYLHYGILKLHFGQATNYAPVEGSGKFNFYAHHPPLMPLLTAGSFSMFGESEAAARAVPISAAIGSMLLVFLLARNSYDIETALLATFLFAFSPAVLFFGRKVGYEALTLMLMLLTVLFYENLRRGASNRQLLALALCAALTAALLADWIAYFLVPILVVQSHRDAKSEKYFWHLQYILPLLALACLLVTFGIFWASSPKHFLNVLGQGATYMGLVGPSSSMAKLYVEARIIFTPKEYAHRIALNLNHLFTYPLVLLACVGLFLRRAHRKLHLGFTEAATLIPALCNWGIFWRSAYFHPWWLYYLSAPFAFLAASGAQLVFKHEVNGAHLRALRRPAIIFLVALALVGGLSELKSFDTQQIRLLPERAFESADLIKDVALTIRNRTNPGSVIVTNFTPNSASRVLPYYSERKIIGGLDSQESIARALTAIPVEHAVYGFFWCGGQENICGQQRTGDDSRHYRENLVVQGRKFELLRIRP